METWNGRNSAGTFGKLPEFIKIVLSAIFIAVAVGIFHNAIAIKMSFKFYLYITEYNLLSDSLIKKLLLRNVSNRYVWAIVWGTFGTWWVGAIFGVILGVFSRTFGSFQLTLSDLLGPMFIETFFVLLLSYLSGFLYYVTLSRKHSIEIVMSILSRNYFLSPNDLLTWDISSCCNFLTVNWINCAMYALSVLFSVVLISWAILRRLYMAHAYRKMIDDRLKGYL